MITKPSKTGTIENRIIRIRMPFDPAKKEEMSALLRGVQLRRGSEQILPGLPDRQLERKRRGKFESDAPEKLGPFEHAILQQAWMKLMSGMVGLLAQGGRRVLPIADLSEIAGGSVHEVGLEYLEGTLAGGMGRVEIDRDKSEVKFEIAARELLNYVQEVQDYRASIKEILRSAGFSTGVANNAVKAVMDVIGASGELPKKKLTKANREARASESQEKRARGRPRKADEELWSIARGLTKASAAQRAAALSTLARRFQRLAEGKAKLS